MPTSAAHMSPRDIMKFHQLEDRKEVDEIYIEESYHNPITQEFTPSSFFVFLIKGFCFEEKGSHCFGEDTLNQIEDSLSLVTLCDCEDCK